MQVQVERLTPTEVSMTVEVDEERVARALDAAYRRLAQRYNVPGFRRGKVPRKVLEQLLGKDALTGEAFDPLVTETFEEALGQEGLDPIGRGEVDGDPVIAPGAPFSYVIKVPVRPEVEVPDVRRLAVTVPRPVVTDADVDAMVQRLAQDHAALVRATQVEADSVVLARVTTEVGGETQDGGGDATIDLARPDVLPGSREALEGAEAGETRQVVWELGADHPTHPGEEAVTRFEVRGVLRRQVPPIDDALAQLAGASSLEMLNTALRAGMERELDQRWRAARLEAAIDALSAETVLDVPDALVDQHFESHWQDLLNRLKRANMGLPAYLAMAGKDEETLRAEMRPDAEKEMRRNMLLESVAIAESLEPADGEIRLAAQQLLPRKRGKGALNAAERRYVRDALRRSKARRLLERLYAGGASDDTDDALSGDDPDGVPRAAAE